MPTKITELFENELNSYLDGSGELTEYYPGMNVLSSSLYKKQQKEASNIVKEANESAVSSFEMYLDTIILNMHTKIKKYKQSRHFENENVREIENQGFIIPFYIDEANDKYVLLGITPYEDTM